MNWDDVKANWQDHAHTVRERWGRIGESQLADIGGDRSRLLDRIRDVYQLSPDEAEQQVAVWEQSQDRSGVRRSAESDISSTQAQPDSGGGTKLHGDKLSQPAALDDEATDELRESTRPGETQPPRDSGTAPSQTQPDPQVSRRRKTERRGE